MREAKPPCETNIGNVHAPEAKTEIEPSESVLHHDVSCRGVDTRPVLNREEHLHPIDVREVKKIQVTKEKRGDSDEPRGYQEHKDTSCVDLITTRRGLSPPD